MCGLVNLQSIKLANMLIVNVLICQLVCDLLIVCH